MMAKHPEEVSRVWKEQQLLLNNHPARSASSAKHWLPAETDSIRNWQIRPHQASLLNKRALAKEPLS